MTVYLGEHDLATWRLISDVRRGTMPVLLHDFANDVHYRADTSTYQVVTALDQIWTFSRNSTVNGWTAGPVLTEFAIDAPAFVIDPATGKALGYRALAGFTNLVLHSDAPSQWATQANGNTQTSEPAPDGEEDTWLVDYADSGTPRQHKPVELTDDNTDQYTFSVFMKKGPSGATDFQLRLEENGGDFTRYAQQSITLSDEWQRFSVTGANEADGNGIAPIVRNAVSENVDAYVWRAQIVQGSIAGPPIETEGSPVSTDPDDGTENVPTGLQSAGTLVVSARTANGVSGDQVLAQMDDGTENNRVRLVRNASREVHYIVTDGGTEVANMNLGTVADDTDTKVAIRYGDDDYAGVISGGTLQTDTTGTMPSISTLRHGRDTADGDEWNGTIADVRGDNAYTDSQLEGAV